MNKCKRFLRQGEIAQDIKDSHFEIDELIRRFSVSKSNIKHSLPSYNDLAVAGSHSRYSLMGNRLYHSVQAR